MKPLCAILFIFIITSSKTNCVQPESDNKIVLVMHGGAGTIKKGIDPEREENYRKDFAKALKAGYKILHEGGSAIDAVETAVALLEDSPLFNAGKGSVFTSKGTHEMDAAIMDGKTLHAGAVCGVQTIKNPIHAARAVMDKTPHVLLCGDGAEEFANEQGLELVEPGYFYDEYRYQQWKKAKDKEGQKPEHSDDGGKAPANTMEEKHGTVGALALDQYGNLAAATSTGGMTNKRYGRVGDTPLIGCGTYADNSSCAVSCTGHGEYFIRTVAAHAVCDLMKYKNLPVKEAAEKVLAQINDLGGEGGLIALDRKGNFAMPFNTVAMIRGYVKKDGNVVVEIF
ncbi:MAG TPA: isoaspartyl peptidase/L-asparaginase [Chitinophagales bacterium]|nr:isoaspartyl peptidase/L-asparaginase [Chitinophagales bacterium]